VPATQRSYVHAVSKFSRYFGHSPGRLDLEDVRAFQVHLVATGISWPALNQTVCALRFFYCVTLGHGEIPERIPYAREPGKLPVVLSADEVIRFLEAVPSLKTRAVLTTAYAAGLRAPWAIAGHLSQAKKCHGTLFPLRPTLRGIFQRTAPQIVVDLGSHGRADRCRRGVPRELSKLTLGRPAI
jgi:integrase